MIVAGDHKHAAMRRGAAGVAVLQRIAGAVDAGALAVPEPEHAIDLAIGLGLDLLRAEHRGRGEVFVDGREGIRCGPASAAPGCARARGRAAERRAAIAGDEAGGVEPAARSRRGAGRARCGRSPACP